MRMFSCCTRFNYGIDSSMNLKTDSYFITVEYWPVSKDQRPSFVFSISTSSSASSSSSSFYYCTSAYEVSANELLLSASSTECEDTKESLDTCLFISSLFIPLLSGLSSCISSQLSWSSAPSRDTMVSALSRPFSKSALKLSEDKLRLIKGDASTESEERNSLKMNAKWACARSKLELVTDSPYIRLTCTSVMMRWTTSRRIPR